MHGLFETATLDFSKCHFDYCKVALRRSKHSANLTFFHAAI